MIIIEPAEVRSKIAAEYEKTLARIREIYPNELMVAERQISDLTGPQRVWHVRQLRELFPEAFGSDNPLLKLVYEHTDPRPFGVRDFNAHVKTVAENMLSDAQARLERFRKQAAEEQNSLYKSVLLDVVKAEEESAEDERQFLEAMEHTIKESDKTYPEMILPTVLKNVDIEVLLNTLATVRKALNLEYVLTLIMRAHG